MIHAIYVHHSLTQDEAIEMVKNTGVSIIYEDSDQNNFAVAYSEEEDVRIVDLAQFSDLDDVYNH